MSDLFVLFILLFDVVFGVFLVIYAVRAIMKFNRQFQFDKHKARYLRALAHAKKYGYPIDEIQQAPLTDFDEGYVAGSSFRRRF